MNYLLIFIITTGLLVSLVNSYTVCRNCASTNSACNINTDEIELVCQYDEPCIDDYCKDRSLLVEYTECEANNECAEGLVCEGGICQDIHYIDTFDRCNNTLQCTPGNLCQYSGMPIGYCYPPYSYPENCTGSVSCSYNAYCDPNSKECLINTAYADRCNTIYQCGSFSICNQGMCMSKYAGQLGDSCAMSYYYLGTPSNRVKLCDISQGLTCQNGKCLPFTNTLGTCGYDFVNVTCNPDYEYCDCDTNTCKNILNITPECKAAEYARDTCFVSHSCADFSDYPSANNNKTCGVSECSQEICLYYQACHSEYKCAPVPEFCKDYGIVPLLSIPLSSSYFKYPPSWPTYATIIVAVGGGLILIIVLIIIIKCCTNRNKNNNKNNNNHHHQNNHQSFISQPVELKQRPIIQEVEEDVYRPPTTTNQVNVEFIAYGNVNGGRSLRPTNLSPTRNNIPNNNRFGLFARLNVQTASKQPYVPPQPYSDNNNEFNNNNNNIYNNNNNNEEENDEHVYNAKSNYGPDFKEPEIETPYIPTPHIPIDDFNVYQQQELQQIQQQQLQQQQSEEKDFYI